MIKEVKYYDEVFMYDNLRIHNHMEDNVVIIVQNKVEEGYQQTSVLLSPSDAISLGRKLIEFGQQQIDNRESK